MYNRYFRLIACLALACIGSWAGAQNHMSECIKQMPQVMMPQVSDQDKAKLVDTYSVGKPSEVDSKLTGKIVLEKLTDNYAKIKTSEIGYTEMKLLPLVNNTSVIALVKTVTTPVKDGNIAFYSPDWKKIETPIIEGEPVANDFYPADLDKSSVKGKKMSELLSVLYLNYQVKLDNNELVISANLDTDEEDARLLKDEIDHMPAITYKWDSGRWVRK